MTHIATERLTIHSEEWTGYLIAGHTARDLLDDGWRIGGSVAYAALGAARAGRRIRVVTGAGPDVRSLRVYEGAQAIIQDTLRTTTFRNVETENGRVQYLHEVGERLDAALIPDELLRPHVLHLAPLFDEIDASFIKAFDAELTGANLQGWMRARDGKRVTQALTDSWEVLHPLIDVAIYSVHDLKYSIISDRVHPVIACCVETLGRDGVRIVEGTRHHLVPTIPLDIQDTDGAGDLFAYEFLAHFFESGDPVAAARAANEFVGRCLNASDLRRTLYPLAGQGAS